MLVTSQAPWKADRLSVAEFASTSHCDRSQNTCKAQWWIKETFTLDITCLQDQCTLWLRCCTGDGLEFELSFVPTDPSWQQGRQLTFNGVLRENFPALGSVDVTVKPAPSLNQRTCSVLDKILASELESIVARQYCSLLQSSTSYWCLAHDKPVTATMLCTASGHAAMAIQTLNFSNGTWWDSNAFESPSCEIFLAYCALAGTNVVIHSNWELDDCIVADGDSRKVFARPDDQHTSHTWSQKTSLLDSKE